MSSDSTRTNGKNAQRTNILAAKLLADIVKTTLGPKGMDKMLVDSAGEITVTNDGVTVLREMEIDHPTARMIIEIAKSQEKEVGDGTTTAVVLAGELLARSEALLDSKIHPTIIISGYKKAIDFGLKKIQELSYDVSDEDMKNIIKTAITGKGAELSGDKIVNILVESIKSFKSTKELDKLLVVSTKTGSSTDSSELLKGLIIEKDINHPDMPLEINKPKIALIDSALEVKNTEIDSKITITDPLKLQSFLDVEEKQLNAFVEQIKASGANAVFCQKGVDDLVQYFLAKNNILVLRRVKKEDMARLSVATKAKIINKVSELSKDHLGSAEKIYVEKLGDDTYIHVEDVAEKRFSTILITGSSEQISAETKRAVEDAIGDIKSVMKLKKFVSGAGAVEVELAKQIRSFAKSFKGREQIVINSFADALEIIPKTLAENSGLDPVTVLTELRNAHESNQNAGINIFNGSVMDSKKQGVIEPLIVKTQALKSAVEVATTILRIDDVIAANKKDLPQNEPEYS